MTTTDPQSETGGKITVPDEAGVAAYVDKLTPDPGSAVGSVPPPNAGDPGERHDGAHAEIPLPIVVDDGDEDEQDQPAPAPEPKHT